MASLKIGNTFFSVCQSEYLWFRSRSRWRSPDAKKEAIGRAEPCLTSGGEAQSRGSILSMEKALQRGGARTGAKPRSKREATGRAEPCLTSGGEAQSRGSILSMEKALQRGGARTGGEAQSHESISSNGSTLKGKLKARMTKERRK